jgi:hypothetical protein
MAGFAKLFSTITTSSLWGGSKEARILFVSMLANADSSGYVEAAIPGLARMANLTLAETEFAINELESPDKYSKSKTAEGRRIAPVEGGWCLINYEHYRNRRDENDRREYLREYMRAYRKGKRVDGPSTPEPDTNVLRSNNDAPPPTEPIGEGSNPSGTGSTANDRAPMVPRHGSEAIAPQIERTGQVDTNPPHHDSVIPGADIFDAEPVRQTPDMPPLLPAASLADWRMLCPSLLVSEGEDVEVARRLVRLFGHHANDDLRKLHKAAQERPAGKRRVFVSELQSYLHRVLIPTRGDYERAGLPIPHDAPPDDEPTK